MNNKMEEVAKMFSKDFDEEFEIEGVKGIKYKFTKYGVEYKPKGTDLAWLPSIAILNKLLTGELKIKWTPFDGEVYYFVYSYHITPIRKLYHSCSGRENLMAKRGLVFRTEEEAIEKMKDLGWWEE